MTYTLFEDNTHDLHTSWDNSGQNELRTFLDSTTISKQKNIALLCLIYLTTPYKIIQKEGARPAQAMPPKKVCI